MAPLELIRPSAVTQIPSPSGWLVDPMVAHEKNDVT